MLAVIPHDSLVLVVWFIVHIILYKRIDEVYKLVLDIVQDHSRRFSFGLHPVVVGTVYAVLHDSALGRLGYNGPEQGTGVILRVCLPVYACAGTLPEACHAIIGGHLPWAGDCPEVIAVDDDCHGIYQRNALDGDYVSVVPVQALVFTDNV